MKTKTTSAESVACPLKVAARTAKYLGMIALSVGQEACSVWWNAADNDRVVHGKCTHVFHMHCLLKWIDSTAAKGLCPMDRRPWGELVV